MNIDELRKNYPFISYGNQYQYWGKLTKWYNWLLDRIINERPAKSTDHDWCKLAIYFQVQMKEREKLFKKLPKPTKEQIKDEEDPDYPWKPGKWPESAMPKIRDFCKCEAETRKYSRQVAAILTENEYCTKVLKEKTYKSRRQEDKERKEKDANA